MKDPRPLMERALEYVGLLAPGSEINEDTDGPVVKDFRHLLPGLLYKRGLYLQPVAGGQRVTDCPPWLVRRLDVPGPAPVWCCRCSRSLFDSACTHGIRYVIDLAEPNWLGATDNARHFVVVRPGARA